MIRAHKLTAAVAIAAASIAVLAGCSTGSTWKASVVRYAEINPADLSNAHGRASSRRPRA